jgi:hypothetical protein
MRTGATRGYNVIRSDNTIVTADFHESAAGTDTGTLRYGTSAAASFTTVASWTMTLPAGATKYKISLTSFTGPSGAQARLLIGASASNVITRGASLPALMTITSPPTGVVTVNLQVQSDGTTGATPQANQRQITLEDAGAFV